MAQSTTWEPLDGWAPCDFEEMAALMGSTVERVLEVYRDLEAQGVMQFAMQPDDPTTLYMRPCLPRGLSPERAMEILTLHLMRRGTSPN